MKTKAEQQKAIKDIILIAIVFLIVYLLFLATRPLSMPDEGRYPSIAKGMLDSKNWITPMINGVPFLDKPPVYYWLQAISMDLLGVNRFAIRLVPALFGVLGIIGTYICAFSLFDRRTAGFSAIILASSPLYFLAAHYANMDLEVAIWLNFSFFCFLIGIGHAKRQRALWLWSSYAFAALTFLTKGLMGIAFPMSIIGLWILLADQWRVIPRMMLPTGLMLMLLIAFPWFHKVNAANTGFYSYFFYYQQVERFLTHGFNAQYPFWFYWPIVLVGTLPWSIPALCGLKSIKTCWHERRSTYRMDWFFAIVLLFILTFFSIPHAKIIGYILPIMPAIAILCARHLAHMMEASTPAFQRCQYGVLTFFVLFGIGVMLYTTHGKVPVKAHHTLIAIGVVMIVLALVSACAWFKRAKLFAIASQSAMVLAPLLLALSAAGQYDHKSIAPLIKHIAPLLAANSQLACYGKYFEDLPLYTQERIWVFYNWTQPNLLKHDNWAREFALGYGDQRNRFPWLMLPNQLQNKWKSTPNLVVFTPQSDKASLLKTLKPKPISLGCRNQICAIKKGLGS